eukprot:372121_1
MGILKYLEPFLRIVPEVEPPDKRVPFRVKLAWTAITLVVFLVCCQIPLYGIRPSDNADPLYWIRVVLASNRGTLMELGISPIVTSGLVLQLLAGSRMIASYHGDKEYKALFQAVQKLFAIIITFGEAIAFIASGVYGHWLYDLGIGNTILIFVQLCGSTILLILLDEIIQRGYGIGNGVSLFIATNICTNIVWKTLSPTTIDTATGIQYEGSIIALFHLLLTRKSIVPALKEAFYRQNLPNITNLFATIVMFIVVIYFQGFRVDLPVKSTKLRGTQGQTKYPIKLFYTSNIPIILHTALVSNIFFLSQVLTNRFGSNIITNLFGKWSDSTAISQINTSYNIGNMDYNSNKPIGGLVYYLSPPHNLFELLCDPINS